MNGRGLIAIVVILDVMLARRKMKLNELPVAAGASVPNLSILKTGKAKAVRFSTLEAICRVLDCQPETGQMALNIESLADTDSTEP